MAFKLLLLDQSYFCGILSVLQQCNTQIRDMLKQVRAFKTILPLEAHAQLTR